MIQLAEEIRREIIEKVSVKGGHLAPNLGVVELTMALHYVFNTPDDLLVWDIGHQAYVHKLLTGRRDRFHTIRQFGGLSGYLRREESPYDVFGASHATTSISPALRPAPARLKSRYWRDRKSTRLNSSHQIISYAVFCLKKKKNHPLETPFTEI